MTAVVDASVIVAALVNDGPAGRWAETLVAGEPLVAPHLIPVEAANILRRTALAGDVSDDIASLAHSDLVALPTELFPYEPFAARVWELRGAVTTYDAWYVAMAESLAVPLATLEGRLARAPRWRFLGPPQPGPTGRVGDNRRRRERVHPTAGLGSRSTDWMNSLITYSATSGAKSSCRPQPHLHHQATGRCRRRREFRPFGRH